MSKRILTSEQVAYIKASSATVRALARELGVSDMAIRFAKDDLYLSSKRLAAWPDDGSEWRDIPGHTGYQASDRGQIRSLITGKALKQHLNEWGYPRANLRGNTVHTHRLVALAFIPNPDGKREINHIDHDKTNNNVSNLEWVTPKENGEKAVAAGAYKNRKLRAYTPLFDDAPKPCALCGTMMTRKPGTYTTRAWVTNKKYCSNKCQRARSKLKKAA